MTQETLSHFFEHLHKDTPLSVYQTIYDDATVFKDPFHEVQGVQAMRAIFVQMYAQLDAPRFVLTEYIGTEDTAYIRWDFIFRFKGESKENRFEGVSRLCFSEEDKIISHTDYWDAAEHLYEKIPLLGSLLRFVKHKIAQRHSE